MPSTENFRAELASRLRQGAQRRVDQIAVNAGDLYRDLGYYPGPKHATPSCCAVMEQARKVGDTILAGLPSGKGVSLTVRFKLPR